MQYSRLISFVALCALPFALPVFATAAPSESDASDFERRDCTATSNAGFIRVAWTQAGQSHSFYLGDTSATLTTGATNQCFLAGHLDGTTLEGEVAAVYTFSACDKHADGTPFAITCSVRSVHLACMQNRFLISVRRPVLRSPTLAERRIQIRMARPTRTGLATQHKLSFGKHVSYTQSGTL